MPSLPVAAKAMLHQWEEPCLCGNTGAGAVFFSGCNLHCVFCQNDSISRGNQGKVLSIEALRTIFRDLIAQGAACLDLVTPTQFTPAILAALGEENWPVPIVWNSGGYEKVETLRLLEGHIQIYLPDFKYALPETGKRYAAAENYYCYAQDAILEMYRQTGDYVLENGLLRRGVLIRHMLLPGELENTRQCIDFIARNFKPGQVLFSLMSQYTPQPDAQGTLLRRVTSSEYRAAIAYMRNCGITDGYIQERTSAREEYTPVFDLSGL